MRKNKFIRPWVLILAGAIVVLFAVIPALNTVASNLMCSKIKNICKDSFNCNIKLEKPRVNTIKSMIVFDNISIDKYIGGRKFNVNVDKVFIKINMASAIKNILYLSSQPTKFFASIDFSYKKHIKVDLRGNVDFRSSKGDFSLETKCSNIDIAYMGQYYTGTPIYFKKGTADISSIGTCRKGKLNFSQRILIKNLFLSTKKDKDLDRQVFIGLDYGDIINYVNEKKGNIDLSFIIKGTLKEPEIDLSPIIENILSDIVALKIS
ncbi:MAG: hypothetical protein Q7J67_09700 [bacterium]|nr:hypothetical protein [bacterium]